MERRSANRSLLRTGFTLLLLGFVTTLVGPVLGDPGVGATGALAGVVGAVCVLLLGLSWRHLNLSLSLGNVLEHLVRAAGIGTWATPVIAGWLGVAGSPPLGYLRSDPPTWPEVVCLALAVLTTITATLSLAVAVYAIRPRPRPPGVGAN